MNNSFVGLAPATASAPAPVPANRPLALLAQTVRALMLVFLLCLTLGHTTRGYAAQTLYSWGFNASGQLADGTTNTSLVPLDFTGRGALSGKTVVQISAAGTFAVALCSDGTVVTWGGNNQGQLGDGTYNDSSIPLNVTGRGALAGKTVTQVGAGGTQVAALCSDGSVVGWGFNAGGQLGAVTNTPNPVAITGGAISGKTVTQIVVGGSHTLALCSDGTLASWGANSNGQLGDGTTTNSAVPLNITNSGALAGKRVSQLFTNNNFNAVICTDNSLITWGFNGSGNLGNGNTTNSSVPVNITGNGALSGKTVTTVAVGGSHTLAACSDGTVAAWGNNGSGRLGDGTTTNSSTPINITGSGALSGKRVAKFSAGSAHSLALCTDGTVLAWGLNTLGQVGDGTTNDALTPKVINGGALTAPLSPGEVEAGANYSLAWSVTPPAPAVTTGGFTNLTATSATLGATINPNGGATTAKIEYGTTTSYGSSANLTLNPNNGTTAQSLTANVSGLAAHTTYHYRASATSGGTTVVGNDATFTTLNTVPILTNIKRVMSERTKATIGTEYLNATDTDGDALTFTLTSLPAQGTLTLDNVTLAVNSTFTPANIAAGKLAYTHTGIGSDSFGFSLSDGFSSTTGTFALQVNAIPPQVVSVNRVAGAISPTNATSIAFTVTFSEPVTGVDTSDFTVFTVASITGSVVGVSGSGTTYTVTVGNIVGDGLIRLDVLDNNSIVDATGTPQSGAFFSGQTYTVDTIRPTVAINQQSGQTDPTATGSVAFSVVFSELVSGLESSDVILSGTATTNGSTINITGSGHSYTVTVSGITGQGTVIASLNAGAASDGVGNLSLASTSTDNTVTVDVVAPNASISLTNGQADPAQTPSAPIVFAVNFSEPVIGFISSDVQLSGSAGATTAEVSGSGAAYTITVSGMTQAGTVVVSFDAGAANDVVGNLSSAPTLIDNSVVYSPQYAPSALTISKTTILEKLPAGTFVGTLYSTDANAGETFTYSLVGGDTAAFTIAGTSLRTAEPFDIATKSSYDITVRTTDSKGLFLDQPFTITVVEATKPVVSISTPSLNQKLLIQNVSGSTISGEATDNVGVTQVRVRLSRKTSSGNEFWNGTAFTATQATVLADVTGSTSATWTLSTNLPPANLLVPGAYSIQVSAFDAAGNRSDYAERGFSLGSDFSAPNAAITTPTAGQKVLFSDFIAGAAQGTASDDMGVASVKIRLSRKEGTVNTYWNGTDFVTASTATVDADLTGSTSATWQLRTNAPPVEKLIAGSYGLTVFAVDGVGNKSAAVTTTFNLSTDFTAPSVAITSPTSSQVLRINEFVDGTLSGTASDNLGVVSVKVKLQRKRGTVTTYWDGSSFVTDVTLVEATYNSQTGTWSLGGIPASALDAGGYTAYATAFDAAGNKTTSASLTFSIVGTPGASDAAGAPAANSASTS